MTSLHPEAAPFALISAIMAVLFLAAMISLWLLRRTEAKLLKNKEALENQIVQQQQDLMTVRQDANAWRGEMQRQFDLFRHMASDQLKVEEKRFDDLLQKSRDREQHLQTSLDIAKQMCAELPGTKARLMQLENAIGLDSGEHLSFSADPVPSAIEPAFRMAPVPDLDQEKPDSTAKVVEPPAQVETINEPTTDQHSNEATELRHLQQQNAQLQQALTATRLRARIRERQVQQRGRNGKK